MFKKALLAGFATLAFAVGAQAADLYAPVHRQNARCGDLGPTISHISATSVAQPMCCPDPAKCTQYLSTTKIALPHLDPRT